MSPALPVVRLGTGALVVTFAAATLKHPAAIMFGPPAPGEDHTPRRVDLTGESEAERRAGWRDALSRAWLVIEAEPGRGFRDLLKALAECAEAAESRP